MSIPSPPLPLSDHCSAVHDNTLYVYTPEGLQALPLKEDADWSELDGGVSVKGAVCVEDTNPATAALYVVGGTPNADNALYSGLQRFVFATQAWETLQPASQVTSNRQHHGAVFLEGTSQILVYAGSQAGDVLPSSQTFLISTVSPYVVNASPSAAPPLFEPMLMPWNSTHALMVGGAQGNRELWVYGNGAWTNLGTTLPAPVVSPDSVKCAMVTGDDGSKVLELFDLGVSPNVVTRYALWENGQPAPVGKVVGAADKSKRDLTVSDWPAYNASLAPTAARSRYSLAQSPDGLVVMTGGGNDDDPIVIFDQTENRWINATSLFVGKAQVPLTKSSSSSLSSATASPSSTAVATPNDGPGPSKARTLTVLGATLGAIFGIAAILIIILLLLRCMREKKKKQQRAVSEKEDRLSFADQGAEFMHEAGGSMGRGFGAAPSKNSSMTSLAMFQPGAKSHRRGMPSDASMAGLVKHKSPLGYNEPVEMGHLRDEKPRFAAPVITTTSPPRNKETGPRSADSSPESSPSKSLEAATRTRSNGWSRYFANNEVTNLASIPAPGATRETFASDMSRSDYGEGPGVSVTGLVGPPPLELNLGPKFEGQRINRVATGSPTMGNSTDDVREGLRAEIRRAESVSSRGSNGEMGRTETRSWTPLDGGVIADRRSGGGNPYFGAPTDRLRSHEALYPPPPPRAPFAGAPVRDSGASNVTVFPSGIEQSPKLAARRAPPAMEFQPPRPPWGGQQQVRDSGRSDVTLFPRGVPSPTSPGFGGKPKVVETKRRSSSVRSGPVIRKTTGNEDMSWLNINAGQRG